ncbi:MAG: hypothetical protein AAGE18_14000 [Pseudomonadota bacterium]
MNILLDLLHPAHAHVFRLFVEEMQARGHRIRILSRQKDVLCDLLDDWGWEHHCLTAQARGSVGLATELLLRARGIRCHAREMKADVMAGLMGPAIALASPFVRAPAVVLYDNETTARLNALVARVAEAWISPRGYRLSHGARHLRYDGYHETCYLHPNRFTPDADRVRQAGLDPDKPYSVVRFVGWESIHDVGEGGFSAAGKRQLVETLKRLGPVAISSEKPLPSDLEPYRLKAPVAGIHHILAFAQLFVGESSTMASEAACLGTKALFVSSTGRGVNDEQEARYGLVTCLHDRDEAKALAWVKAAVEDRDLTAKAAEGYERLKADTVDVTGFLVDFFETRYGRAKTSAAT